MNTIEEALLAIRKRPPVWAVDAPMPPLRLRGGGQLSTKACSRLIADLKSAGPDSRAEHAAAVQDAIEPSDLAELVRALMQAWARAGQPARDRRWLIFAMGSFGDDVLIDDLGRRVGEELQAKRHKAAGHCLEALARAGGPTARRWLARWARKAPGLSLRAAAWSARLQLDEAAGWTAAVAPHHHGFSQRAEQDYSHGGRPLTLRLGEDGQIRLFDGSRALKSLPAARKRDDPEAVRASRERFKRLKTAVKDSLEALHAALEEAMCLDHPLADWDVLKSAPLGWAASRGLVFEARPEAGPPRRFFLSDEGDPLNRSGDDVILPPGAPIHVAHPLRMSETESSAWRTILEDARALQPFEQLHRPIRRPKPGPAPLSAVLKTRSPMAMPQLIRGLKAQGYLPDNIEGYGMITRSMRFFGPYLIILSHDAYPTNPFHQAPEKMLRLRSIEVRHGARTIPSEALQPTVFSEIACTLTGL